MIALFLAVIIGEIAYIWKVFRMRGRCRGYLDQKYERYIYLRKLCSVFLD